MVLVRSLVGAVLGVLVLFTAVALAQQRGRGAGEGNQPYRLTFPAAQRPPADPAIVARGKAQYDINCRSCHGADLRGGDLGGPNLLRSQLVLNDQHGELILPVVRNGSSSPGIGAMPPFKLPQDDVVAIAEYIHTVAANRARAEGPAPALNLLVGNPRAGQAYFARNCASCHSPAGDLAGIASRISDIALLQSTWVGGVSGVLGRVAPEPKRPTTVTVTPRNGAAVTGRLLRMDDFVVVLAFDDGTQRSFRRDGRESPLVEVDNPLEGHRRLMTVLTDSDMHDVTAYLATLK
jgi:cytochrome c oxidase cbb3-type subunit 3